MIESSSEIINFYKGRDVSPYLFHFVKGANPFQVLEQMLAKCLTHCEYYNFLGEIFTQEQLDKSCRDYWNSMTENRNNLILDKGYEGLFVGDAIVKAIECKNYINGESKDVE